MVNPNSKQSDKISVTIDEKKYVSASAQLSDQGNTYISSLHLSHTILSKIVGN